MSYEQKSTNLFMGVIGFVIGCCILLVANAQEPTIRIPTNNYQSISPDGGFEITEEGITSVNSSSKPTVELIESKGHGVSKENRGAKKTAQRGIQPLLRTGDKLVLVKGFPEDSMATKIVTYAYQVSNGDMDFLMTLKAENGGFDMLKQSNVVVNGIREDSWGLCQLNRRRHKDIVDTKEFWESYEYQVDKCWEKYKGGTKFYGYNARLKFKNDFTILDK